MSRLTLLLLVLAACGPRDGGTNAAGLRLCANTGVRSVPSASSCFLISPRDTALSGEGETDDHFVVGSNSRDELLVFLNGSGGSPQNAAGTSGWYDVAAQEGLAVIGLSYRSGKAVGQLCRMVDLCYEPSRVTLLTGLQQPEAAGELANVSHDEGIITRLSALLQHLISKDPDGAWERFFDATRLPDDAAAIRWERLIISGHSQGGGHAALIGKRHVVRRVISLASPCDAANGTSASWLTRDASWQTPAPRFFGLWAPGDAICPVAPTAFAAMSLPSGNAITTAKPCAAAHNGPLTCEENAETWRSLLR